LGKKIGLRKGAENQEKLIFFEKNHFF